MSKLVDKLINPAGSGEAVGLCREARNEISRLQGELDRVKSKANRYGLALMDCSDVIEVLLQGETDSAEYKIMVNAKELLQETP